MHKVTISGIDTSSLPKLSAAKSRELLDRIGEGDEEARELFLRANMRLVLSVVGRFSASRESADDLFQAGMVGMMKALNNFDRTLGMRFSTYAVPMMRQVACALDAVSEPVSFFEPAFSDGEDGMQLIDQLADEKENADSWSERIALAEALKQVPERELAVLKMRYFDGKTQNEISEKVGVSQAQVSRLEKSAVARLKKLME